MRAFKRYRGIRIYRERVRICGSDIKELKDGRLVNVSPKYDVWYKTSDGARCYTVKEVKKDIDNWIADVMIACEVDEDQALKLCQREDDEAVYC